MYGGFKGASTDAPPYTWAGQAHQAPTWAVGPCVA